METKYSTIYKFAVTVNEREVLSNFEKDLLDLHNSLIGYSELDSALEFDTEDDHALFTMHDIRTTINTIDMLLSGIPAKLVPAPPERVK